MAKTEALDPKMTILQFQGVKLEELCQLNPKKLENPTFEMTLENNMELCIASSGFPISTLVPGKKYSIVLTIVEE